MVRILELQGAPSALDLFGFEWVLDIVSPFASGVLLESLLRAGRQQLVASDLALDRSISKEVRKYLLKDPTVQNTS